MPKKFRKLPIQVEALQWNGSNVGEIDEFIGKRPAPGKRFVVPNDDGNMLWCSVTDWVIKDVRGKFYPCCKDVFEVTYREYVRIEKESI